MGAERRNTNRDSARPFRIAAAGDFHFDGKSRGRLHELFAQAAREADVLLLCGDQTTHGEPEQARGFVEELEGVDIPILAVLGNHDHEHGKADEVAAVLEDRGIRVLDGDSVVIGGVGFAGVKGFGGGFGRSVLGPFGEEATKLYVKTAVDEVLKLEEALRTLHTRTKVVLMHYAPIAETLHGEPEMIWAFLGTSRLVQPLETFGASVVFHGHAHLGAPEGRTPSGTPVYNVAVHVLREVGMPFRIWTTEAPERRRGD